MTPSFVNIDGTTAGISKYIYIYIYTKKDFKSLGIGFLYEK